MYVLFFLLYLSAFKLTDGKKKSLLIGAVKVEKKLLNSSNSKVAGCFLVALPNIFQHSRRTFCRREHRRSWILCVRHASQQQPVLQRGGLGRQIRGEASVCAQASVQRWVRKNCQCEKKNILWLQFSFFPVTTELSFRSWRFVLTSK